MIGVYDSGLGGMLLLPELIKKYPNEKFLYLGDRERAPYGTKSKEELETIIADNFAFFKREGITDLVIACNTLCSVIDFNKDYEFKVHDIISKTAKQLVNEKESNIVVFATPLTIKLGRYEKELNALGCNHVCYHALTNLAKLIEDFASEEEIEKYLVSEFADLPEKVDAMILGCTHFPIVKKIFAKHYPNAHIYDSNDLEFDLTEKHEGHEVVVVCKPEPSLDHFINDYVKVDYKYYEEDCSRIR